jgi:hypothetical protein
MLHENYVKIESLERVIKGGAQAVASMEKFIQFDANDDVKLQTKKEAVRTATLPTKQKEILESHLQLQELLQRTPEYFAYNEALAHKERVTHSLT